MKTKKPVLKTPDAWSHIYDLTVWDSDGWRQPNNEKSWSEPITEKEFLDRVVISTILPGKKCKLIARPKRKTKKAVKNGKVNRRSVQN